MSIENKDVDLYAELADALKADESEVEETVVASDQKPKEEVDTSKTKVDEGGELSEDEISKLSPRAQKRIRDLAEQVKVFADKPKEETPEEKKIISEELDETKDSPKFKSVQEFLGAVEDEPSRKLLETFYGVIKGDISNTLAPVEKANAEAKFEKEFNIYESIDGISDYKSDLKKTFLRNPNQSLKALVGEVVTDLQLHKVKPIEKTPSTPNRDGKVDLDGLSTEELYNHLDSLRG